MDIRINVGLKVETTRVSLVLPSSAAEKQSTSVLHAHFDQLVVQPDLLNVKLYSKGLISETVSTRVTTMTSANYTAEQVVTLINDTCIITNGSIEVMGHYPTLLSVGVGMSIKETLGK